jgi:hypothetical protein
MKVTPTLTFLIFTCCCAYGQNLIGYNDAEIKKFMRENRKDMFINTVRNNKFKYLKYSDNSESQTILFFLTEDSVCKSVRVICDYTVKTEKIKELNSNYKKAGENRWIDNHEGKNYIIEIKDEVWSVVITIKPEK